MAWLNVVLGLVVLTIGADLLVRGSTSLARRLGLSELLIGLTLVGFGTSTPELVSSIEAALAGAPGVAIGNVVGSNIANILLIFGLCAAIAPMAVEPKAFRRDGLALAAATMAAIAAMALGDLGRIAGGLFLLGLVAYIAIAYLTERGGRDIEAKRHEADAAALPAAPKGGALVAVLLSIAGLALLMVGAKFLVGGAVVVAGALGVSETIIGLTVVAVGTSLPELVTSVAAALRGKSDLALGNVIGSNLYNILGILGATALIAPIPVDPRILGFDNWTMLAATAALIFFARTGHRVTRLEGGALLLAYGAYLGWLILSA